jgi:hypothetical protein
MSELVISLIVFVIVIGAAVVGAFLNRVLPEHHFSKESKEIINLGIGVIVTLTALVLGLLVASAKDSFDTKSREMRQGSLKILLLDHHLRQYGAETKEARALLRRWADDSAAAVWGAESRPGMSPTASAEWVAFIDKLHALAPTDDAQRALQRKMLELGDDLAQTRWLLNEQQSDSSIQTPFLLVVVLWLAIIFMSFGLLAPRNGTVIAVIVLSALSLSTAIFLILELDRPFDGAIRISDTPYRTVVKELGR